MTRLYKTSWNFADRSNIDKTFFEMMQNAMENTPLFRNKQLFFQYVTLLYIGGKRRIEPFLKPVTIAKFESKNKNKYYRITSMVAKHYEIRKGDYPTTKCSVCGLTMRTKNQRKAHKLETKHKPFIIVSPRRLTTIPFRAENIYEHALFSYLLQNHLQETIDFTSLLPPRYASMDPEAMLKNTTKHSDMFNGLTIKFKMFKTDITDGRQIIKNTSITPHMLRHARAYDLIVLHGYKKAVVQQLLNWDTENMVDRYTDIRDMLKENELIQEYERTPPNNNISEILASSQVSK
jgi:hypothetical protein